MRKVLFTLSFFAIISLFASKSFSQDLYFNITNNSDYLLYGIMISPYDSADPYFTDWSDDLLTAETFDPGVSVDIYIPADFYPTYCNFQFKLSYYAVDGSYQEKVLCWVDACEKGYVSFDNDWNCTYGD
jgi:hypothetical protein